MKWGYSKSLIPFELNQGELRCECPFSMNPKCYSEYGWIQMAKLTRIENMHEDDHGACEPDLVLNIIYFLSICLSVYVLSLSFYNRRVNL